MNTRKLGRVGAASLSAMIAALAVAAAPAIAANTRLIYVGDPGGSIQFDGNGNELNGSLTYSRTRPGGLTAVTVEVRNDGGQTVNHAFLLGGYAADTAPVNPLFPPPGGLSLPAGLTYAAAYPASASVGCTIGPDGNGIAARSLSCDLGALPARSGTSVLVVVGTPAGADASFSTWFGAYLAESNQTGTNQDNFYAVGTLATTTPTCDTSPTKNKDANYFLPSTKVGLSAASCVGTTPGQSGSIASKGALSGTGTYAEVSIGDTALVCPAGFTCYGKAVEAHVLNGGPVPGGLLWTVTWYGTKSLSGAIHFWDTYNASDPAHASDFTLIPFTRKLRCSATLTTNCWVTTSSSKGNANPLWFQATFVTPDNGKGGGYF